MLKSMHDFIGKVYLMDSLSSADLQETASIMFQIHIVINISNLKFKFAKVSRRSHFWSQNFDCLMFPFIIFLLRFDFWAKTLKTYWNFCRGPNTERNLRGEWLREKSNENQLKELFAWLDLVFAAWAVEWSVHNPTTRLIVWRRKS